MFTNFHTPESTLIMLVSAFAGREHILSAYKTAVANRYRFFPMGTVCLFASWLCQLLKAISCQVKKLLAHYIGYHLVSGGLLKLFSNCFFELRNIFLRKGQAETTHKVFK